MYRFFFLYKSNNCNATFPLSISDIEPTGTFTQYRSRAVLVTWDNQGAWITNQSLRWVDNSNNKRQSLRRIPTALVGGGERGGVLRPQLR